MLKLSHEYKDVPAIDKRTRRVTIGRSHRRDCLRCRYEKLVGEMRKKGHTQEQIDSITLEEIIAASGREKFSGAVDVAPTREGGPILFQGRWLS
ncbi:MAG: hypothetical protein AB1631_20635 [Acidobacteriota bacterium]